MAVGFFIKMVILGSLIGGVFITKRLVRVHDDNLVEEVAEQMIEDELGIEIDLTPGSPDGSSSELVENISRLVAQQAEKI